MVPGQPGVLDTAAHSGTQPGCGDCEWTLILACIVNSPNQPHDQNPCDTAIVPVKCKRGQILYRLYLSDDASANQLIDSLCLGGVDDVVPVGDIARADVQRYLKDVTPPDLVLTTQPHHGTLAGLATYFMVRPPHDLQPAPFGGGQVRETITIAPQEYRWGWGDGTTSPWTADAGAPYPDGTLTHVYPRAADVTGMVTARWGGTYTITVAGRTFGPYAAIGTVTRTRRFALTVYTAHSHLVSHG